MKKVGIFYGHWNILRPVGIFYGNLAIYVHSGPLVYLPRLGMYIY
jgi:hypothetical protein